MWALWVNMAGTGLCTHFLVCVCVCVCVYKNICVEIYMYIYTHMNSEVLVHMSRLQQGTVDSNTRAAISFSNFSSVFFFFSSILILYAKLLTISPLVEREVIICLFLPYCLSSVLCNHLYVLQAFLELPATVCTSSPFLRFYEGKFTSMILKSPNRILSLIYSLITTFLLSSLP